MSRDPITALTQQAYGYANNDPLNFIDPSGLNWLSDRLSDAGGAIAAGTRAVGGSVGAHVPEVVAGLIVVGGVVCLVATDGACAPVVGKALAYGATTLIGSGAVGLFVYDAHEIARTPWTDKGEPRRCSDDFYNRLGQTSLGFLGSAGPLLDPVPHSGELPPSPPPPAPPFIVP